MTLESLHQPNLYKGPNSSKEFNERNLRIRNDINRLYQLMNENAVDIEKNMDIALRENFFLQNEVTTLTSEVERLKGLLEEKAELERGEASNILLENFYQSQNIINGKGNKSALIDRTHGVVTPLPTNTTSKLSYETDSGEVFLPSGLNLFLKEAKNTEKSDNGELVYYDIEGVNAEYIADRKEDTFWIREVSFPTKDSVTEVFGELHIQLPTEGLNNLFANTLVIHPYPEGSMRIRDIQYKGFGNQWSRLENYPLEEKQGEWVPKTIDNARKLLFQFNKTEMTEIRIFYSQPYWFENQGISTFTYGFQSVDLEYRLYTEKNCEFVTKLDITEKQALLSRVEEPEVIPAKGTPSNLTNLVEHHLYYDEQMETEFDFNQDILASIQTVYVKTILKKEGDIVPVLKEIRIPYVFKSLD